MVGMFHGASGFNQPLGGWSVDEVTDMGWMLNDASAFNQPIGGWRVDNVTTMHQMFHGASAFRPGVPRTIKLQFLGSKEIEDCQCTEDDWSRGSSISMLGIGLQSAGDPYRDPYR